MMKRKGICFLKERKWKVKKAKRKQKNDVFL